MAWNASTDNVGVVAYDIERDGSPLVSVDGATLDFTDSTVAPDTSYRYEVFARDAAGNTSGMSNPLDVTTPSQPSVLVLGPTDDATLRENRPDRNLGGNSTLEVDASSLKNTLLRFDVSGIGGANVVSATLRLHAVDGSNHGGTFVSTTDTSWSENDVSWATAPAADGRALGSWGSVSAGSWYELDVSALVVGDGAYSIRMTSPNVNGADYVSKEGLAGLTPELVIVLG
jgi:hypothetical protein